MADAAELFEQGVSLQDQGSFEEALVSFDQVIELDPKKGDAWYRKAVCLTELERYNEAME